MKIIESPMWVERSERWGWTPATLDRLCRLGFDLREISGKTPALREAQQEKLIRECMEEVGIPEKAIEAEIRGMRGPLNACKVRKAGSMTADERRASDALYVAQIVSSLFRGTAKEVAEASGKTEGWVRKLAPEMAEKGLAQKTGTAWLFAAAAAAEYIKNRPDGRGAKKKQLSRQEMGEAVRRDALFLNDRDPGKTERVYVLIWQGHVADRQGDILPPTGREQDLIGWGNKWDGPAAGFGYDSGAIWVPKKYL